VTPDQARALISRLRRMQDATRNGRPAFLPDGSVSRLDLVERRLLTAVQRALTPGPERDGFPSGHLGGGSTSEEDEDYHPDSSTQHAAFTRLKGGAKDPMSAATLLAYRHLETAVNELAALGMQLDHIDEVFSTPYRSSNPGGSCLACDRHVEGTAVDRLRRGLCERDYRQWLRSGKPDIMEFRRTREQGEAA
jgi:hypothetical protein